MNKIEKATQEIKEEQPRYCLDEIIYFLNGPRLTGFGDRMEKEVFTEKDFKIIAERIWHKILSEEEWRHMAEHLDEAVKKAKIKIEYEEPEKPKEK